MRGVARDERQLDARVADGQARRLALVLDLDDVDALLREQQEQLRELARPVGHAAAHDEVAPRNREPVAHHRDEQRRVDVAAGEHRHDAAGAADLAGEQRRDADRARAFDDELRALEQQHDRLADLLVGDGDDVVEHAVENAHRQLARTSSRRCRPRS